MKAPPESVVTTLAPSSGSEWHWHSRLRRQRERCNFSAFWFQATYLHTLSLGFLVYEMGPVIIPHNSVVLESSIMTRDNWHVVGVQ